MGDPSAGARARLGVYGGAFDPPHHAHVAVARAALAQLRLDRLLIIPTGDAWHKTRTLTPATHRLALCAAAFGDLPGVSLDDREMRRPGPSYTVDTLEALRREHPAAEWFLVIGEDQWRGFAGWRRPGDIRAWATVAVAGRAGVPAMPPTDDLGAPPVRLSLTLSGLSATAIRARLADPASRAAALRELVPPAVAGYISQHHLYQNPS